MLGEAGALQASIETINTHAATLTIRVCFIRVLTTLRVGPESGVDYVLTIAGKQAPKVLCLQCTRLNLGLGRQVSHDRMERPRVGHERPRHPLVGLKPHDPSALLRFLHR